MGNANTHLPHHPKTAAPLRHSGFCFYNKTNRYRTENENKVLKAFRLFPTICKNEKEKGDNRIAPIVALCRDDVTRTRDPYVPNVVRYQLRYIPIFIIVLIDLIESISLL